MRVNWLRTSRITSIQCLTKRQRCSFGVEWEGFYNSDQNQQQHQQQSNKQPT